MKNNTTEKIIADELGKGLWEAIPQHVRDKFMQDHPDKTDEEIMEVVGEKAINLMKSEGKYDIIKELEDQIEDEDFISKLTKTEESSLSEQIKDIEVTISCISDDINNLISDFVKDPYAVEVSLDEDMKQFTKALDEEIEKLNLISLRVNKKEEYLEYYQSKEEEENE